MPEQRREPRLRVPQQSIDVSIVEFPKVRVEVPGLRVGICPRIHRQSAGGYA
jgi:hypothetical protein